MEWVAPPGAWGTVPPSTCLLYYRKELLVQQRSHQIMIPWAIMLFASGSSFYQLIGHEKGESRSSLMTTIVNTFHHICNRILPFSFSLWLSSVVTHCSEFNLRPQHACPLSRFQLFQGSFGDDATALLRAWLPEYPCRPKQAWYNIMSSRLMGRDHVIPCYLDVMWQEDLQHRKLRHGMWESRQSCVGLSCHWCTLSRL